MLNFKDWTARAAAFTAGLTRLQGTVKTEALVAPPLNMEALQRLEATLPRLLPLPLRSFLLEGSANCACRYVWDPPAHLCEQLPEILDGGVYGGAELCNAEELVGYGRDCHAWAMETWVAESPDDQVLWLHATPFAALANGDYLGLDLSKQESDPPVVYLCHDDQSSLIAPNFASFLLAWETLCYIGPEIWLLDKFRDPGSGYLDSETPEAERLRHLFGAVRAE
jgi:hypothetical protein